MNKIFKYSNSKFVANLLKSCRVVLSCVSISACGNIYNQKMDLKGNEKKDPDQKVGSDKNNVEKESENDENVEDRNNVELRVGNAIENTVEVNDGEDEVEAFEDEDCEKFLSGDMGNKIWEKFGINSLGVKTSAEVLKNVVSKLLNENFPRLIGNSTNKTIFDRDLDENSYSFWIEIIRNTFTTEMVNLKTKVLREVIRIELEAYLKLKGAGLELQKSGLEPTFAFVDSELYYLVRLVKEGKLGSFKSFNSEKLSELWVGCSDEGREKVIEMLDSYLLAWNIALIRQVIKNINKFKSGVFDMVDVRSYDFDICDFFSRTILGETLKNMKCWLSNIVVLEDVFQRYCYDFRSEDIFFKCIPKSLKKSILDDLDEKIVSKNFGQWEDGVENVFEMSFDSIAIYSLQLFGEQHLRVNKMWNGMLWRNRERMFDDLAEWGVFVRRSDINSIKDKSFKTAMGEWRNGRDSVIEATIRQFNKLKKCFFIETVKIYCSIIRNFEEFFKGRRVFDFSDIYLAFNLNSDIYKEQIILLCQDRNYATNNAYSTFLNKYKSFSTSNGNVNRLIMVLDKEVNILRNIVLLELEDLWDNFLLEIAKVNFNSKMFGNLLCKTVLCSLEKLERDIINLEVLAYKIDESK